MNQWQIVDCRLKTSKGCYYVSLAYTPEGAPIYIGRFCPRPRDVSEVPAHVYHNGLVDWHWNRLNGIYSGTLETVKLACEADLKNLSCF